MYRFQQLNCSDWMCVLLKMTNNCEIRWQLILWLTENWVRSMNTIDRLKQSNSKHCTFFFLFTNQICSDNFRGMFWINGFGTILWLRKRWYLNRMDIHLWLKLIVEIIVCVATHNHHFPLIVSRKSKMNRDFECYPSLVTLDLEQKLWKFQRRAFKILQNAKEVPFYLCVKRKPQFVRFHRYLCRISAKYLWFSIFDQKNQISIQFLRVRCLRREPNKPFSNLVPLYEKYSPNDTYRTATSL